MISVSPDKQNNLSEEKPVLSFDRQANVSEEKPALISVSLDNITNASEEKNDIAPPDSKIALSPDKIIITSSEEKQPVIIPAQQPVQKEIISRDLRNWTVTHKDYLKDRNDRNTYNFTLHCTSAVNIVFNPSGKDNASYTLTVKNNSQNILTQKIIYGENLFSNTGNLYLRAGNYSVTIQRAYSWSGKPYSLTINVSQAANTEEESNNIIDEANIIPLNENVRASTGTNSDIDYFVFTLDKAYYVSPSLEFSPVRTEQGIYDLKLYELAILNADKKPFIFRGDNKTSKEIKQFILEAGKYIIVISRLEDTKLELGLHEYTLRVEAKEIF